MAIYNLRTGEVGHYIEELDPDPLKADPRSVARENTVDSMNSLIYRVSDKIKIYP